LAVGYEEWRDQVLDCNSYYTFKWRQLILEVGLEMQMWESSYR
jgi:hypothetical protein